MRTLPVMPKHGVGVVWWPALDPLCRPEAGLVQVIEAEPETFWSPTTGGTSGFTSRLARSIAHLPQPKLLHGVGAPFGGRAAQTAAHRDTLARDIAAVQPCWISDHLNFNRFDAKTSDGAPHAMFTGFFLPPAQGAGGVAQAASHIACRRAATGVPVAFENAVSYLPPLPGEMPDGDFVAAVAEAADCGILLDLHNVLCNARNGRQSVEEFCAAIPLDRVWEIHLAGGAEERGFWLDAHSGLVEPELMEIVVDLVPRLPSLGAIIFEIVPESIDDAGLPGIAKLLGRLNDVWSTRPAAPVICSKRATPHLPCTIPPSLWERLIGTAVTGRETPDVPAHLLPWLSEAEAGLALYTFLVQEGRASSLVVTAPRTIRHLLRSLGEAQTRALLARFWHHASVGYTSIEEGRAFLAFMSDVEAGTPDISVQIDADQQALDRHETTC